MFPLFELQVTESIVAIVSNIAQVDAGTLESAEQETGAVSKFVRVFEEQINTITVTSGKPFSIRQQNVAVQVHGPYRVLLFMIPQKGLSILQRYCFFNSNPITI